MTDSKTVDPVIIQQFLSEKYNVESLSEKLLGLGLDEESVASYIVAYKKARNATRQTAGAIYLVAGAVLGFISCVLALVNPVPELHNWFLYGLTSVAILLACYGLYNLLE